MAVSAGFADPEALAGAGATELEQLRRLIDAASGCMGPCGRARAARITEHPGARAFVSTSCAAVLQSWRVERDHHIVRLVVETVEAHLRRHRDCGWFLLNLCLRITLALAGLATSGASGGVRRIPRPAALQGLALAASWIEASLSNDECACRVPLVWSNLTSLRAVLRAALCKPVALASPRDSRHVGLSLVEAFLEVLPASYDASLLLHVHESIRYHWVLGPETSSSFLIRGLLLDTPASLPVSSMALGETEFRIALFDVSLEAWLPHVSADAGAVGIEHCELELLQDSMDGANEFRKWEVAQFRRLADSLVQSGIRVLGCQKLVDPWFCDYLYQRGVTVLARLSIRHIDHVSRFSGAVPVTSLQALPKDWADVCGYVGRIERRVICEKEYTIIHPAMKTADGERAPRKVATIVFGAPNEHTLDELKRCVPQAVHCLTETVRSGAALLGAGLTEVYLGDELAKRAALFEGEATDAAVRHATLVVSECLQDLATCLVARSGAGAAGALVERERFLEGARLGLGQVADGSGTTDKIHALDAEVPKRQALQGALELAGILLRLGRVVDVRSQALG